MYEQVEEYRNEINEKHRKYVHEHTVEVNAKRRTYAQKHMGGQDLIGRKHNKKIRMK